MSGLSNVKGKDLLLPYIPPVVLGIDIERVGLTCRDTGRSWTMKIDIFDSFSGDVCALEHFYRRKSTRKRSWKSIIISPMKRRTKNET